MRTGDTPQSERASMRRRPPQIVVTTPESLYVLLGSESGRKMLSTTRTVIVDEIHALAPNKRGSHLALSLERLAALTPTPPVRVGLSATQKPIEEIARYLVGTQAPAGALRHRRRRTRARARSRARSFRRRRSKRSCRAKSGSRSTRGSPTLTQEHRTTLVFVNTRRMAERVARHLSELIGNGRRHRAPRQPRQGAAASTPSSG